MPITPEIEKVARAMLFRDWSPCLWTPEEMWATALETKQEIYIGRAIAALEAIRDASPAMYEAGANANHKTLIIPTKCPHCGGPL